ncbi:DNA-binding GntR family transcriptional regulator [Amycolatopsis echigonensis]|uniref:DNA-binding GntR family transcriptional regulator n=2 Tax=Amycolatopsis echigonensis TaxID=2576905 RepID=A0A2N3WNV1_9PSEU|nr:DNA-binding GntR family transcriptional regulator [Amycolatopsis niigatensis]
MIWQIVYPGSMKQMLSEQIYDRVRDAIMRGEVEPGQALKPQELAARYEVSLAVVREALVRLVGEGLAERLTNRGFAVPTLADQRWQEIIEARRTVEPAMLRMSVARGDLEWETRVRAAGHRLARTPMYVPEEGSYYSAAWAEAHRLFHRTLLDGCGNAVLLETFDRMWMASELARRWTVHPAYRIPVEDVLAQHEGLERAALSRDPEAAAELLTDHLAATAAVLTGAEAAGE